MIQTRKKVVVVLYIYIRKTIIRSEHFTWVTSYKSPLSISASGSTYTRYIYNNAGWRFLYRNISTSLLCELYTGTTLIIHELVFRLYKFPYYSWIGREEKKVEEKPKKNGFSSIQKNSHVSSRIHFHRIFNPTNEICIVVSTIFCICSKKIILNKSL